MARDRVEQALSELNEFGKGSKFDLSIEHGPDEHTVRLDWRGAAVSVLVSPVPHLRMRIVYPNGSYFEGEMPMAFQVADNGSFTASISPVDVKGNPAKVESVVWASSDPAIMTVVPDATDPMKAVFTAVGPLGTAQVQVSADADLGAGVTTINGTADVEVIASQAVALNVNLASN